MKNVAILILLLLALSAPAFATTALYADANVSGGSHNGTAANPFQTLQTAPAWVIINNALVSDDVVVYVSCRQVASDVSKVFGEIVLQRTDTSTHRLTLDGMTKWNQNDTTPSWADYGGSSTRLTSKARVNSNGEGWAIGWGGSGIVPSMDYMTIRGFEATGSAARFRLEGGGSHFIIEYNYVHDVSGGGPGMTFNSGAYAYSAGPTTINPSGVCTLRIGHLSDDVIFRYNVINNTADENLYFGGNGEDGSQAAHGFDCPGHTNIQFIGNTLSNPGAYGVGEADCFDLKNGVRNITYRGNIVGPCGRNGIPLMGAAISYQPQNVTVEENLIHDTNTLGLSYGAINVINTWDTVPNTDHIQSNIVYNGIILASDGSADSAGNGAKYSIYIDNNTVDGGLIASKYIHTGSIRNNIVLWNAADAVSYAQVAGFTESNNAVYTTGPGGSGDITLSSGQVSALFTNRAGHVYTIASTSSQAYHAGVTISPTFADYNGNNWPVTYDMGAIQYASLPASFTISPTTNPRGNTVTLTAAGTNTAWANTYTYMIFPTANGLITAATTCSSTTACTAVVNIALATVIGIYDVSIITIGP